MTSCEAEKSVEATFDAVNRGLVWSVGDTLNSTPVLAQMRRTSGRAVTVGRTRGSSLGLEKRSQSWYAAADDARVDLHGSPDPEHVAMPCYVVGLRDNLVDPVGAETPSENDNETEGEDAEKNGTLEGWKPETHQSRKRQNVYDRVGDDCERGLCPELSAKYKRERPGHLHQWWSFVNTVVTIIEVPVIPRRSGMVSMAFYCYMSGGYLHALRPEDNQKDWHKRHNQRNGPLCEAPEPGVERCDPKVRHED